ncbi:MAG: glutamylcysteine synthetase [Lachnospiraceae bacterium]|nr:glutamylcysteine synthetase [Lachnospiraceae bacterium]
MDQQRIRERLYQKYIEPTKRKRKDYIGIEIEIPIVNLQKEAVDYEIVHQVTDCFLHRFGFIPVGIDDEGNIHSAQNKENGDILSYDCSYNNLEFSLGKGAELFSLYNRFSGYYTYIKKEFEKYHYTLTGMGVNPYRSYNHRIPIPNGRYRMLFHHLESYKKYEHLPIYFHKYPDYGLFSSASQVQLDIDYEDLMLTLDVFSKIEPIKALLFSNSILLGEQEDLLCCRDMFWENSTHGINPHNIGMMECQLETMDDLLAYIESTSIYCVERGDKYINFEPIRITEYFKQESVLGEYYDKESEIYKEIKVYPDIDDINYLRTFKFEDLTFRGTIEFRSVCCQPIKDCMTVAAFHLGLKDQLDELNDILKKDYSIYHLGYTATELRKMFVKREIPSFIDQDALYHFAGKVLDLSWRGLVKRGYGEESFLMPLYERLENRTNPGKQLLELLEQGESLEDMILAYGKL